MRSARAEANSSFVQRLSNFASNVQRTPFGSEETFAPTAPRFKEIFQPGIRRKQSLPESKHALSLSVDKQLLLLTRKRNQGGTLSPIGRTLETMASDRNTGEREMKIPLRSENRTVRKVRFERACASFPSEGFPLRNGRAPSKKRPLPSFSVVIGRA